MPQKEKRLYTCVRYLIPLAPIGLLLVGASISKSSAVDVSVFHPGNILVSRSVYQGTATTVTVGQQLPPGCKGTSAKKSTCVTAIANGTYPTVFNNNTTDGSFGVTSPIFLDQFTPAGTFVGTVPVPTTSLVTSFSSKSEIALNLSQDGSVVTFMGYSAPVNTVDVSNSSTPGVLDNTNPVATPYSRVIAQVDANANFQTTLTNAYSGNNGRAAALANGFYYMAGNANNGSGTPANVVASAGAQIAVPGSTPGAPQEIGNFSITQVPNAGGGQLYPTPDKVGKDNNFRGLTIFSNTMFITKGSGGNGINTVYQVGNAGKLPTTGNAANEPITILPGFTTTLAAAPTGVTNPFGIWFANSTTLYVADEGDGTAADASTSPYAGLQKWTLANGAWHLDYVLQKGLNLGVPYNPPNNTTDATAYPMPATDGLRNLTGRVNNDGTVTLWAVTSTVSTSGDQGADPNLLVTITDKLANTNPAGAAGESFTTIDQAKYGEVLRGVSFTPGTPDVSATASFVGTDTTTQGSWMGTYGADSQILAGDGNVPPAYGTVSLPTASTFVWTTGSDPRFLQKVPPATGRIAGAYYGNSFTIDLNLEPGPLHQLALYMLDEDTNARSQTITIADALTGRVLDSRSFSNFHNGVWGVWNVQGNVLVEVANTGPSNAVVSGIFLGGSTSPTINDPTISITSPGPGGISLNTTLIANATAVSPATISNVQFFANGSPVSGPLTGAGPTYNFSFPTTTLPNGAYSLTAVATDSEGRTTTSSPVAVTITNAVTTSVIFVGSDTTTEGTWKPSYGAQGDLIAFDSFVQPAFALATFNAAPPYLWTTTNATQAMQRLTLPGRIASAWGSALGFTLDVNFTDGNTHQLSLYFLDWDGAGRAETVTLFDADTNSPISGALDTENVSGFGLGKYLTWNITGHVLIQFTKTAGSTAIVNGVFFNN
ncbi:MAG: Ig-like domain-containing protein [Bryobacteraceae bacterium]|jgi:hypothetical protein